MTRLSLYKFVFSHVVMRDSLPCVTFELGDEEESLHACVACQTKKLIGPLRLHERQAHIVSADFLECHCLVCETVHPDKSWKHVRFIANPGDEFAAKSSFSVGASSSERAPQPFRGLRFVWEIGIFQM